MAVETTEPLVVKYEMMVVGCVRVVVIAVTMAAKEPTVV